MREYELYLILDGDAEEEDVSGTLAKVTELIPAGGDQPGGEVIKVDARGKRRLAYPIKRKVDSHDVVIRFKSSPQTLAELERILKLDEQVLRYLIVRMSEE
jgi:small subunit ribosomal protein S6